MKGWCLDFTKCKEGKQIERERVGGKVRRLAAGRVENKSTSNEEEGLMWDGIM